MEGTKEHAIPQNIMSVEFKLIGDMSLRQFAYIAIPLFIGFMFYVFHVNTSFTIILTVIFLLIAMFLAFVPIDGRPADTFLTNFIISIKNPTQRVFNKGIDIPDILKISRRPIPLSYVNKDASTLLYQSPTDFTISNSDNVKSFSQLDDREKLMMKNIDSAIRSTNVPSNVNPNTASPQNIQGSAVGNVGGANNEYNPFDINDTYEDVAKKDVAESSNININNQLLNENSDNVKAEDQSLLNNPSVQNPINENNISSTPVQGNNISNNDSNLNVSNLNIPQGSQSNPTTVGSTNINDTLSPSTQSVIPDTSPFIDSSLGNNSTDSNVSGMNNNMQNSLNNNSSQNIPNSNVNMSTPNVTQDSVPTVKDLEPNASPQNQLNTILDKIKALEDENRRLKEELESEDSNKNKETLVEEAPVVNQQELINHLPDFINTPNVVSGIVLTHDSKILTNAIVIIKDASSKPIRAVKTNQLGQFYLRTPLANGQYNVEVTYPGITFNAVGLNLDGNKINPLIFVPVEN